MNFWEWLSFQEKPCSESSHKFVPRYNEVPIGLTIPAEILAQMLRDGESTFNIRDMLVREEYVGDICIKCGSFVEKSKSPAEGNDIP